jgi:hypothetical protein
MTIFNALYFWIGVVGISVLTGLGTQWNQMSIFSACLFFVLYVGLDLILTEIKHLKDK